ncbi:MAG TPA: alpha-1,4-glucan--maltose-1-phosphate maltosyltransferase [Candidatus Binataceae bacterium]|nr:alpha-1,4-glucan--maltose-1-phosphate maltosyltransferase [Candidatus Binataceae bacterium]
MVGHIIIEGVTPCGECGRYPIKRVVGEACIVEADVFRDGHQLLKASLLWRRADAEGFNEVPMQALANDRWRGQFVPLDNVPHIFTIEAWTDRFGSWLSDFIKKVHAGKAVRGDLLEGIALLRDSNGYAQAEDAELILRAIAQLTPLNDATAALAIVTQPELTQAMGRALVRPDKTRYEPAVRVIVDREQARFSAWYEIFVRSQGDQPGHSGTFAQAEQRLPAIRDMGFDVVYLTPIHPIGETNRKGAGNSLHARDGDPGSPWAIGNQSGGHTSIDPALGTIEDFDRFVAAANRLGMEVALDFAIQCSPDHPWVKQHPQWFQHRPDGSIKYAENPPKEYQDIYPIDFDTSDYEALRQELLNIVRYWIAHGVRIFRVDNPHTKPVAFWSWLIAEVQTVRPDVIFLAEAFTRPKMMMALAKAGFTQSYSYFTWRNTKVELTNYLSELTQPAVSDFFRPNFFANTPDILSPILQTGGAPAFKMRLILAATLSPAYGIYSGFELCENEAEPGTEEYLASEKYQIKIRDWNRKGNIKEFVALINQIRNANPALREFTNLRFLTTDSEDIILYAKATADLGNVILVAVNLDPFQAHYCTAFVPPEVVGVAPGQRYRVTDLLTGAVYEWGDRNYVRLDPVIEPAHILRVDGRL